VQAIAAALPSAAALKVLDLSDTNMCNITAMTTAARAEWSADGLQALMDGLPASAIAELHLDENGICGLWADNICGDPVTRGTYKPAGVEVILDVLAKKERLPLKRDGQPPARGGRRAARAGAQGQCEQERQEGGRLARRRRSRGRHGRTRAQEADAV